MPNYCKNKLEINGTPEQISNFVKKYFIKNEENNTILNFNKVIPEPKTKKELMDKYGSKYIVDDNHTHIEQLSSDPEIAYMQKHFDWYNWRIKYWGTKWLPCYIEEPEISQNKITLYYDTAWSPADGIITKLVIDNPELTINNYYYEPGMDFAGCIGDVNYEVKDSPNFGKIRWAINKGLESQEFLDETIKQDLTRKRKKIKD